MLAQTLDHQRVPESMPRFTDFETKTGQRFAFDRYQALPLAEIYQTLIRLMKPA